MAVGGAEDGTVGFEGVVWGAAVGTQGAVPAQVTE